MQKKKFKSSFSFFVLVFTLLILVIAVIAFIVCMRQFMPGSKQHFMHFIFIAAYSLLLVVIAILLICLPRRIILATGHVDIVFVFHTIKIDLKEIDDISVYHSFKSALKFKMLTSGGFFGHIGYYYISDVGMVLSFATNLSNAVFICAGKRKIIISPDQPVEFVDSVKRMTAG